MRNYYYLLIKPEYEHDYPKAMELLSSTVWGKNTIIMEILDTALNAYPVDPTSKKDLDMMCRLLQNSLQPGNVVHILSKPRRRAARARAKPAEVIPIFSEDPVVEEAGTKKEEESNPFSWDNINQIDY